MLPELGHIALAIAFSCAVLQAMSAAPLIRSFSFARLGEYAALAQAGALISAFLLLIVSFIQSDFSVLLVAQNSHSTKPLLYKIAGAWGNHEGSMLLWAVLLALYGAAFTQLSRLQNEERQIAISVLGVISVLTILFLLAASNPFVRLVPAALDGRGLNPLLQDPGLAIHPPVLYAGYVGFAIPYAIAVALLITRNFDRINANEMLPWLFAPVAFMTLGVGLGSWWAYRELGWGGWWFWDPVENASLLPLLTGIALAHSALVWRNRGALAHWTLVLACASFSFSVFGAFLVRSGVLTSVHSFAVDPTRGAMIFSFFVLLAGAGLGLAWLRRGGGDVSQRSFVLLSRETAIVGGILLLMVSTATILTGTIYPLILEAIGSAPVSVGAPYYNITVTPILLALLVVMTCAPLIRWRGHQLKTLVRDLRAPLGAFIGASAIAVLFSAMNFIQAMLLGVCIACLVATLRAPSIERRATFKRKWKRRDFGVVLAHGGFLVAAIGVIGAAFLSNEQIVSVKAGDRVVMAGHVLTFQGVYRYQGDNYTGERADIKLVKEGSLRESVIAPERRWYAAAQTATTEAAIKRSLWADLYVTIGDLSVPGATEPDWALRVYHRPFISWIWAGCLIAFIGAMISGIGFLAATRNAPVRKTATVSKLETAMAQ